VVTVPAGVTGGARCPRCGPALLATLLWGLLLGGCAQTGSPPVAERSPVFGSPTSYTVQPGDTLYSIAWRFGVDHRALARANDIRPPYTIYPGQRLRLAEQPLADGSGGARRSEPRRSEPAAPRPGAGAPAAAVGSWRAPTTAPVSRPFGSGNKGLDYQLSAGHSVTAAAAGEVVYAGSGLGGYRHLVIVKHDVQFLSAYSFDRDLAVREGQRIKAGALLADNVDGGRRPGTLHFEIRKDGDPVNPRALIGAGS